MKKISIAILLALFLIPGIINASGSTIPPPPYQVSTPAMPVIPAIKVAPIVSLPLAGQHPTPCPERIEKIIIRETKEIVVLPKGMILIKNLSDLKKVKKSSKIWKDWDGKMYELK